MLQNLIPLPPRPKEGVGELIDRFGKVQALQGEVRKAVSRLETEKQFNRKVEINALVRKLKVDLALFGDQQMNAATEVTLKQVVEAPDLKSLNELLTQSMKQMQIQQLIRNENLAEVVEAIKGQLSGATAAEELFAAAILGRLAAVARGRESDVFSAGSELFLIEEPPSIETLADGDEKDYASRVLAYVDADWLIPYCAREALAIDTANNARRELLRILLNRSGNLADSLRHLADANAVIKSVEQPETRVKRLRRIYEAMADVARSFDGDVGREPGAALALNFDGLVRGATSTSDNEALYGALDAAVGILVRIVELRFSHALQSETYRLVLDGKKLLAPGPWARFVESSSMIPKVQMNLLETALVLARQNRTDKEILRAMEACWPSTSQISAAVKRHFAGAADIDPEIADYWLKVGRVAQSERAVEHKLGNTEDEQIGELLIQLDANRDSMGKLNSAVVPVLKTFDTCQAATVQRAATGYESIAQVAERLARMRKLSKTDWVGNVVEYNPVEHDMEGGHRSGVRRVKVVRDGIRKEFGGKTKMLVKPRVEPEE
ncbi:DUF4391 domain-containing protein [Pseudoxanthomonas mexicana]|uniref:DUF4391 domain-containing protein n=1 Tax=Pseudoxanthomonas mexicana TaxID=128785 RepID=UPI001FD70557|nr:DUF4391 domain-containing protein [Pseudoxanthomonas mexicana]UOV04136.1 DUF4391 domain-containing protein [Pseudoxanthomonas mexicana]